MDPDTLTMTQCKMPRAGAYLGNDVGVVGVDPRVVEADGGGLDGAAIQLQRAEVEGDARVGLRVLQRVQPGAVGRAVEHKVALHDPVQDEAGLAPAPQCTASSSRKSYWRQEHCLGRFRGSQPGTSL